MANTSITGNIHLARRLPDAGKALLVGTIDATTAFSLMPVWTRYVKRDVSRLVARQNAGVDNLPANAVFVLIFTFLDESTRVGAESLYDWATLTAFEANAFSIEHLHQPLATKLAEAEQANVEIALPA